MCRGDRERGGGGRGGQAGRRAEEGRKGRKGGKKEKGRICLYAYDTSRLRKESMQIGSSSLRPLPSSSPCALRPCPCCLVPFFHHPPRAPSPISPGCVCDCLCMYECIRCPRGLSLGGSAVLLGYSLLCIPLLSIWALHHSWICWAGISCIQTHPSLMLVACMCAGPSRRQRGRRRRSTWRCKQCLAKCVQVSLGCILDARLFS